MNRMLQIIGLQALEGEGCDAQDAKLIASAETPLDEIMYWAGKVRQKFFGDRIELCAIANARAGSCSEDCRFCAQSAHYETGAESYPMLKAEDLFARAHEAKEAGAWCFGIVTSGPTVEGEELGQVAEAVRKITGELKMQCSASLGKLEKEGFLLLKGAGLRIYHHNLETSERFFPAVCTTHTWRERVETVKAARDAGLEVCCGGLLGLGENWQDRASLALTCAKLGVKSVPLNFLHPVEGTPLQDTAPVPPLDILRTIALFRLCLPESSIRICGGREKALRDLQSQIFAAGANGMMVGNYLTTAGRNLEDDLRMIEDLGLTPVSPEL